MLPPMDSLATGIGALPHTDPRKACNDVLAIYPEVPYIPTLPARGILESIVFCDSPRLPGGMIVDDRIVVNRSPYLAMEMEQIYLDFVEQHTEPYALTARYASGFVEMLGKTLPGPRLLKWQLTGPVTFGMQVVDQDRRPIYYDEQYADILPKMLGLRARWCEQAMKTIPGVSRTLVVLNEPYLTALGSSIIPISRDAVVSGWQDMASLLEDGLGVHCCSNTDWGFVMSLSPSVISLDAYTGSREFLLYMDALAGYLESGGVVAWGMVPADYRVFAGESKESLLKRYREIRRQVTEYIPSDLFESHSLITPTCGIRFADETGALEIMRTAAWISAQIRGDHPG
jgi:hypothetical protein